MAESKRLENAGMNSAIELSGPYFHCLGLHRASFVLPPFAKKELGV